MMSLTKNTIVAVSLLFNEQHRLSAKSRGKVEPNRPRQTHARTWPKPDLSGYWTYSWLGLEGTLREMLLLLYGLHGLLLLLGGHYAVDCLVNLCAPGTVSNPVDRALSLRLHNSVLWNSLGLCAHGIIISRPPLHVKDVAAAHRKPFLG